MLVDILSIRFPTVLKQILAVNFYGTITYIQSNKVMFAVLRSRIPICFDFQNSGYVIKVFCYYSIKKIVFFFVFLTVEMIWYEFAFSGVGANEAVLFPDLLMSFFFDYDLVLLCFICDALVNTYYSLPNIHLCGTPVNVHCL